jgi:hypothetical protein
MIELNPNIGGDVGAMWSMIVNGKTEADRVAMEDVNSPQYKSAELMLKTFTDMYDAKQGRANQQLLADKNNAGRGTGGGGSDEEPFDYGKAIEEKRKTIDDYETQRKNIEAEIAKEKAGGGDKARIAALEDRSKSLGKLIDNEFKAKDKLEADYYPKGIKSDTVVLPSDARRNTAIQNARFIRFDLNSNPKKFRKQAGDLVIKEYPNGNLRAYTHEGDAVWEYSSNTKTVRNIGGGGVKPRPRRDDTGGATGGAGATGRPALGDIFK